MVPVSLMASLYLEQDKRMRVDVRSAGAWQGWQLGRKAKRRHPHLLQRELQKLASTAAGSHAIALLSSPEIQRRDSLLQVHIAERLFLQEVRALSAVFGQELVRLVERIQRAIVLFLKVLARGQVSEGVHLLPDLSSSKKGVQYLSASCSVPTTSGSANATAPDPGCS